MSVDATCWAWERPVKGDAKLLLLALADFVSEEVDVVDSPRMRENLSFLTGISPSRIDSIIRTLLKQGHLGRVAFGNPREEYLYLVGVEHRHGFLPRVSRRGT